ncbi:MAG: hypothetical protein ACFBSF_08365 [Leptolyngbyaceae cyanobacterium]
MLRSANIRAFLATAAFASVTLFGMTSVEAQDKSLWLYNGQSTTIEGYFYEGEYIYGECDQDCMDLDLFLYDASGNLVYQDVEPDSAPIVVAPFDGSFSIEVSMPSCVHPEGCEVWVSSDHGF